MKQTYVVIMKCGEYDECATHVLYAGQDLNMALEISKTTPYIAEGNEYVWIDVWERGKVVEVVEIREFETLMIKS